MNRALLLVKDLGFIPVVDLGGAGGLFKPEEPFGGLALGRNRTLLFGKDLAVVPVLDLGWAGGYSKPAEPGGGLALGYNRALLLVKDMVFFPVPMLVEQVVIPNEQSQLEVLLLV